MLLDGEESYGVMSLDLQFLEVMVLTMFGVQLVNVTILKMLVHRSNMVVVG